MASWQLAETIVCRGFSPSNLKEPKFLVANHLEIDISAKSDDAPVNFSKD